MKIIFFHFKALSLLQSISNCQVKFIWEGKKKQQYLLNIYETGTKVQSLDLGQLEVLRCPQYHQHFTCHPHQQLCHTHYPLTLWGLSVPQASLSPLHLCCQPSLPLSFLRCPTKSVQPLIHVQLCKERHATYLESSQISPFILEEEKHTAQHRRFHFLLHSDTCSYLLNGFIRCFKNPDM